MGWFKMPGKEGERTLTEQLLGLDRALNQAEGKTIMDLGCAEGLIALEFAKAGASHVWGIDYKQEFVDAANRLLQDYAQQNDPLPVAFVAGDLRDAIAARERPPFDIVLALAILHKLPSPEDALRFAADCCRSLLVIRLPRNSVGEIVCKQAPHAKVNVREALPRLGFFLEAVCAGPRCEAVMYWRRK